jgi:poly-gamma-glutamate capsule biosynthesis protein CapA/YwtB (metallophosphatase superfamily)
MTRLLSVLAGVVLGVAAVSGPPPPLDAQQITLIAGGDIEWSRAVKPPDIYFDRERQRGEWLPVPYINMPENVAYLSSRGVAIDTMQGHHKTSIQYGLTFRSKEEEARYPLERVAPVLREADIAFANLETPLSDRARHTGAFLTPTAFADALRWAGIDVVSTANNHAMDAEETGLLDTIEALERVGVGYAGTGRDLEEARRPFLIEREGIRIAFLAYAQFVNGGASNFALPDRSGVAPMSPPIIREDIRRARDRVDLVVVSVHWSIENSQDTHPEDRSFAKMVLDAGADIVLGHHPHVPRGVEVYKGKPIVYSLGNLIFGHSHDYWVDNYLARFTLTRAGVTQVEILPVAGSGTDLAQPFLLEGERARRTLEDVQARTARLDTRMEIVGDRGVIRIVR